MASRDLLPTHAVLGKCPGEAGPPVVVGRGQDREAEEFGHGNGDFAGSVRPWPVMVG